jgi:hypothetical protein
MAGGCEEAEWPTKSKCAPRNDTIKEGPSKARAFFYDFDLLCAEGG